MFTSISDDIPVSERSSAIDMVLALKSNTVQASITNALSRYCTPNSRVAICVSGGVDSMSLLHASSRTQLPTEASLRHFASAKDLATHRTNAPLVITVDHQLRSASSGEAAFVCETADRAGLSSITLELDWDGENVAHNRIMEVARSKRYLEIANTCLDNGVDRLMTAHHQGASKTCVPLGIRSAVLQIVVMSRETSNLKDILFRRSARDSDDEAAVWQRLVWSGCDAPDDKHVTSARQS